MSENNLDAEWEEYYPKVFGFFFRRLNEKGEVEDLTSLTMHSFFKAKYVDKKTILSPNAYLWQIARNQLNVYIKNKSKQMVALSWEEEIETENYCSHYTKKVEEIMDCFRNSIPAEDVLIVEKIIMNDITSVELAKELGLNPGNIRQKLSRSLKKIRQKCINLWQNHSHI